MNALFDRLKSRLPGRVGASAASDWRSTMATRTRVAAVIGIVWAIGIVSRLFWLQVWQHDEMVTRAARQQNRTIELAAKRGDILDRNGRVIAMSAEADSIYAAFTEAKRDSKSRDKDKGEKSKNKPTDEDESKEAREAREKAERDEWVRSTVTSVCSALRDCTGDERKQLIERLTAKPAFAFIRRFVEPQQAERVAALNIKGIGFVKESKRYYPNGELAAHLLGYVGTEHNGLGGLEHTYNKLISGRKGVALVQVDATQAAFSRIEKPPTAGASLELTLDTYLQHLAERELRAGVQANRARGGTAIVMDPRTGEILAMANEPTFDPNDYRESSETERRNRAVQDLYEPGSTFKLVTASAALQEKVMPPDEPIDTQGGTIRLGGGRIVHDDHHYGILSMTDVIVKSSNVGAIKIGFRLGTDRLSDYVQRFGFGKPASPDFPGESPGIVWDRQKWTESALASVSMGYQVGVTPLQMVTAASAVANGGELMEPRVVRAVYRDQLRYPVPPKVVRRVIDQNTAATLTTIMEGVVERGTAKQAQIDGYTIAGKTGTAAKLVDGRYSKQDYNASFVGFVPSRDPMFAILVVVDSPHNGTYYGGSVSAPIFKRIAEGALRHLGVSKSLEPPATVLVAKAGPVPAAEPQLQPTVMSTPTPTDAVPDVAGLSAREATRVMAQLGMSPRLVGDGFVIAQTPPPGAPITAGAECKLVLGRLQARREQDTTAKP